MVGASNRRSTAMPMEVLNATGQAALNVNALVSSEGSFHHVERQAHLPGRATADPDSTQGLQIMANKIVERELLGPPGSGPLLASESNLGGLPVNMGVENPEPTSGRGRVLKNNEKTAGAEAVRDGAPLVKFRPEVSEDQRKVGKTVKARVSSADMYSRNTVACAPKTKIKAQPYAPKKEELKIAPRSYGRQKPSRFAFRGVHLIPGLRGQRSITEMRYMPVDVVTEQKEKVYRKDGMGLSGKQILQNVAEWVESKSGNISKVSYIFTVRSTFAFWVPKR